MNRTSCSQTSRMMERLLESDDPRKLTQADRDHIETCVDCRTAAARVAATEAGLGEFVEGIRLAESPRRFKLPTDSPVAMPEVSAIPAFLLVGAFALVLILTVLPFLRPARTETGVTPISTPAQSGSGDVRIALGTIMRADGWVVPPGSPITSSSELFRCYGNARLQFSNGTSISLQGAKFQAFPGGLVLKQGQIEVAVPKKGLVFSVTTPVTVLGIRGTHFIVRVAESGETVVSVSEGEISVTTVRNEEYPLRAGNSATVSAQGAWVFGPIGAGFPSTFTPEIGSQNPEVRSPTSAPSSISVTGIGSRSETLLDE